jgi:rhodanese-related sulfurtransferase/peroxiredoxin
MVAGAAGGWLSIRTMQVLRSAHSYSADKAAFDLPALAGSSHVRLAEHRGRPVVVDFFATWCVYCTLELPGLVQVAKAGAGQVDFIAVQTEDTGDGVAMARRFGLAEAGITLAHDIGPAPASQLWSAFGATGIPVTAFYDAQGKLVDFSAGMSGEAELLQRIKRVFGLDLHAADASSLQAPVSPLTPQGAAELLGSTGVNKAYTVLDVSTPAQFAAGHLRGAVRLDATAPNPAARLSARSRETSYIVYGRDAARAVALADRMHQMGFKHVYEIEGGFAAWTTAGLPAAW